MIDLTNILIRLPARWGAPLLQAEEHLKQLLFID